MVKESVCNAGDTEDVGSIPGSGRSPGGRNGNPLQYSFLGNLMDRGAWQAAVHGVTKGQTRLSNWALIHSHSTLLFGKKKVKCICLSNELIETLNFSLVWKTTLGLHHSVIKRKLLLRKWIVIYLNSDALGIDRKIWLWLTKAVKKRIQAYFSSSVMEASLQKA